MWRGDRVQVCEGAGVLECKGARVPGALVQRAGVLRITDRGSRTTDRGPRTAEKE